MKQKKLESKNIKKCPKRPSDHPILKNILMGDDGIIRGYFYSMIGKGWFKILRAFYGNELDLYVDDLCSEIYLVLFLKNQKESSEGIVNDSSFLWKMIQYKSIAEERYHKRIIRFDFYQNEEDDHE